MRKKLETHYELQTEDGFFIRAIIYADGSGITLKTGAGHDRFEINHSSKDTLEKLIALFQEALKLYE